MGSKAKLKHLYLQKRRSKETRDRALVVTAVTMVTLVLLAHNEVAIQGIVELAQLICDAGATMASLISASAVLITQKCISAAQWFAFSFLPACGHGVLAMCTMCWRGAVLFVEEFWSFRGQLITNFALCLTLLGFWRSHKPAKQIVVYQQSHNFEYPQNLPCPTSLPSQTADSKTISTQLSVPSSCLPSTAEPAWDWLDVSVTPLAENSAEYAEVSSYVSGSQRNSSKVTAISAIKNPYLWAQFCNTRAYLQHKLGPEFRQLRLFHGTSRAAAEKIILSGFDRSFALPTGALGAGTYFSPYSGFALSYARDTQKKYMLLADVIVGKSTAVQTRFAAGRVLPEGFQSVTEGALDPHQYCIYRDFQAYPLYLIELRA